MYAPHLITFTLGHYALRPLQARKARSYLLPDERRSAVPEWRDHYQHKRYKRGVTVMCNLPIPRRTTYLGDTEGQNSGLLLNAAKGWTISRKSVIEASIIYIDPSTHCCGQ